MLVLSRRREESIVIGSDIVITVVDVQGGRVRLGIEAPRDVSIRRHELLEGPPAGRHEAGRASEFAVVR